MDHCEGPTLLLFEDIDLIGNALNGQDSKTSHNLRVISQLRTLLDEFGKVTSLITGRVYSFLVCQFPNSKKHWKFDRLIVLKLQILDHFPTKKA